MRCVTVLLLTAAWANAEDLACTFITSVPPLLRAEGLKELIGDITLTCNGGPVVPAGQPLPAWDITVGLNTRITNRSFGNNPGFTDALLLVDDPPPAKQSFAPILPGSMLSFTGAPLISGGGALNFSGGEAPNIFQASLLNPTTLGFFGLPFDGFPHTFRFTNMRADATVATRVVPTVRITGPDGRVIILPSSLVSGIVSPGLSTSVVPGAGSHQFPYATGLLSPPYSLPPAPAGSIVYGESFPTVFSAPVGAAQNTPGAIYNEAGFTSLRFNSPLQDYGTRLKAVFNNIPAGVSIFVPTTPKSTVTGSQTPAGQARLLSSATVAGATGLAGLPVTGGAATAEWEVTGADPKVRESFAIPVYVAFNSGGTLATAPLAPTTIMVQPSFSGISGVNSFAPSPGPPAAFFTINSATGLTPQLFGSLDSRPCIPGAFNDPNNACAPGSGPRLTITSDSGVLRPLVGVSTTGGIGVTVPQSFSTSSSPVSDFLTVTAPAGTPAGTYRQTVTATAPGAANTLSLAFDVKVLPVGGPVITAAGFADAFSYLGGSIAPGQVYALFGAIPTPGGALVSGTLDSSGILGTSVANTQVFFDSTLSPLLYVANGQLSGVAPFNLRGKTSTQVTVVSGGITSPAITLPVVTAQLAVAGANASGGGPGVILNQNQKLNTPDNPATIGEILTIYASYAGPSTVTGTDGRTTVSAPYPAPTGPTSVTIGGVPATDIRYFGNAPTQLESVLQINVAVPPGVKPGTRVPVVVSAGGATSSGSITMAVR